jgi:hypothetical protein
MATLEELLALMPDNDNGEISAADMRTVITGVWDEILATAGQGITLIPEGTLPPLGSPPGIYGFLPTPEVVKFATASYTTEGDTVECPVPDDVAIGDAVIFIPAFVPVTAGGDNITVDADGWTELLDYSPQQARKPAAYAYLVPDQEALDALGETVTATSVNAGRRAGVTYAIPGALVDEAWPTYASGSNRSAATINDNTTTGCTIQQIGTVTVPFNRVVLMVISDAESTPAEADGFTQVAWAGGSAGGSEPFTLTVLTKALSEAPVPAAIVTHPEALSTSHGGGQFIIPAA